MVCTVSSGAIGNNSVLQMAGKSMAFSSCLIQLMNYSDSLGMKWKISGNSKAYLLLTGDQRPKNDPTSHIFKN